MSIEPDPVVDSRAVLWSSRPEELATRPLLLLLHGVGAHEGDLFALSPQLPLEPVIASLRAPLPYGGGWSWFELGTPIDPKSEGVDGAARAVLAWLDALDPAPPWIGLLGFSQGGAVAMQLLRHAPARFAFVVQLSGFVMSGELPGDAELEALRPPVFWGRGNQDPIIPAEAVEHTAQWLPSHSTLDVRIYEGMAHAVSGPELVDIAAFIRRQH